MEILRKVWSKEQGSESLIFTGTCRNVRKKIVLIIPSSAVDSLERRKPLKRGPDRLEQGVVLNRMKFNKPKCCILHPWWGNIK